MQENPKPIRIQQKKLISGSRNQQKAGPEPPTTAPSQCLYRRSYPLGYPVLVLNASHLGVYLLGAVVAPLSTLSDSQEGCRIVTTAQCPCFSMLVFQF